MNNNTMSIDGCSQSHQQEAAAASATSRWNPTKEQINMLEGLYKQGIRTPSAEQIQHITSKLKVYGHIEGKNVFYWFQNHKARQRQKQKQETNLLYFNRFLHHKPTTVVTPSSSPTVFIPPYPTSLPGPPPPPPPPPYNNNVICNQFYIPPPPPSSQANIGYYHQYPITMVPLPAAGVVKRRSSRTGVMMMERKLESNASGAGFYAAQNNRMVQPDAMQRGVVVVGGGDVNEDNNTNTPPPLPSKNITSRNETLELFPVHPTGVLDDHLQQPNEDFIPCSSPFTAERNDDFLHKQPFFDFFAGQKQQH